MIQRQCVRLVVALAVGSWVVVGCGGGGTPVTPPPPPSECTDSVRVAVAIADTVPVFSWTPDCTIGRILVEQGIDEYWGSETYGKNTYRSPIVYNINPPDTAPEEPARPLTRGQIYHVTLFRWVTYTPVESLQVVGSRDFTP